MRFRRRKPEPQPVVEPRHPALTVDEQRELAVRWSQMACLFCGGWHGGLCNRVRSVEMDEAGRPRKTVFWEHWEPNPRTIWPEDVWPSPAGMAAEMEAQARQRANEAEIQREVLRTAQRQKSESQRRETPAEIAARAMGRQGG